MYMSTVDVMSSSSYLHVPHGTSGCGLVAINSEWGIVVPKARSYFTNCTRGILDGPRIRKVSIGILWETLVV